MFTQDNGKPGGLRIFTGNEIQLTVVRVVTTSWYDGKGVHFKRSLNVLKRKSVGMNILQEECSCVGAEECVENITNFLEVADGIYELVICNVSRDIETGYADDWDLKLIPYQEGSNG